MSWVSSDEVLRFDAVGRITLDAHGLLLEIA